MKWTEEIQKKFNSSLEEILTYYGISHKHIIIDKPINSISVDNLPLINLGWTKKSGSIMHLIKLVEEYYPYLAIHYRIYHINWLREEITEIQFYKINEIIKKIRNEKLSDLQ